MKTLLALSILFVSAFAHAGSEMRSYDCDIGDDGIGGYYCHYEFSKCTLPTCEEAAACIAKKVHKDRENKKVNVFVASDAISEVVRGGEKTTRIPVQTQYKNCNGRQCLTPMIVYTRIVPPAHIFKVGQCQAVALELVGDTK
jgi:hypothetical protein